MLLIKGALYRLERLNGGAWQLHLEGTDRACTVRPNGDPRGGCRCSCADFTYRAAGRTAYACKHIRGLVEVDLAPDYEPPPRWS